MKRLLIIAAFVALFVVLAPPAFAADGFECESQGGGAACTQESDCSASAGFENIGAFDCAQPGDTPDDPSICCRRLLDATENGCTQMKGTCRSACDDRTEEAVMSCGDNSIARVCCVEKIGASTSAQTAASARGSDTKLFDPLQGKNLIEILNRIIQTFLGVVGSIALLVFFYAGVVYMTAGSSDRIKKAIAAMKYAAIGLLIIMAAFIISSVYITSLTNIPSQVQPTVTLPE